MKPFLPLLLCASLCQASPSGTKKLSFLLTNDLHGNLEPNFSRLGTLARELRESNEAMAGNAATFILDSGDQFQGTLMSNFDEGESVFRAMNALGYDAVVPGNHDYDFGPIGWLYDKVTPGKTSDHPREVIEKLARLARFPLLSANTYLKASLRSGGRSIPLNDQCEPSDQTPAIPLDFGSGERPAFLKPYVILEKAGVRVALIGLDHPATPSTTTKENVADLCFRKELPTYLEIRESLEGRADVFVLLIHDGNSKNAREASILAEEINRARPDGVHLVAAGHTHFVHNDLSGGVRVVQDGANGKAYGRVDLYYDPETRKVLAEKTESKAGITIPESVLKDPAIEEIVQEARERVAPLAGKVIGTLDSQVAVNRISESALGNLLTDALRTGTGAEIALMNTGGIRAPLPAGTLRYEQIFQVLPFQNEAVLLDETPWSILKAALASAIQTCGRYGTLAQSGLKIRFIRNCGSGATARDLDPGAALVRVETRDGRLLYDRDSGFSVNDSTTFRVATLDFIAAGGSGYGMFSAVKQSSTAGINRELIVNALIQNPELLKTRVDGRFVELSPQ